MATKDKPARTYADIAKDLHELGRLARLEKKHLGGVTPRTAKRFSELTAEVAAVSAI